MKIPSITTLARETAVFERYQDGALYYSIEYVDDGKFKTFEFPIPVEHAAGGAFLPRDKALRFLRWIRKHHALITAAREEQA